MSGDCGHGWGYHFDGASGPCYRCIADENVKLAKLEKDLQVLHTAVSNLVAKNLLLITENESLRQRLAVASGRS